MKLALFLAFISSTGNWEELLSKKSELRPIEDGASNMNYDFCHEGTRYFLRQAPPMTKMLYSDMSIEHEVLDKLYPLGLAVKPLHFNPKNSTLVTEYIHHNDEPINLLDKETRKAILKQLQAIEESGISVTRQFRPYKDILHLVEVISSQAIDPLPAKFYNTLLPALEQIDKILRQNPKKSLCHLDLHHQNVLKSEDRFWIIDWEYATMSHPLLTLASMASIERWNDEQMLVLLRDYNPTYTDEDWRVLYLYRIVADIFWTAWNHIQSKVSQRDAPYELWESLYFKAAMERVMGDTLLHQGMTERH